MTLTEFLLTRIAEDEAETRVMRNRILAECEAKRQILETREKLDRALAVDDPLGMHGDGGQLYTLDWVLQRLALPYADHPQFQAEWRP